VKNIDRFPYREASEAVLKEALERDAKDAVAAYLLGCLQYNLGKGKEAIGAWEQAVAANPEEFSSQRALGLAYGEQGYDVAEAGKHLEKAVELNPSHVRTMNDLSALYARAGRFHEQVAVLKRALERSPADDDLAEGLIAAYVVTGRYGEADRIISTHRFQPRHRSYGLRDRYRFMRYGMGAKAFHEGTYPEALKQFQAALNPPVSLGVDDFQFESTPRVNYYIGRALEAMGRMAEAKAAYEKSIYGFEHLSGDWDSLNVENFHMALSLEKLGRTADATRLLEQLEGFARTQFDSQRVYRRAASRYLLALVRKHERQSAEARRLMDEALQVQPDLLGLRLELRGDVIDPLPPIE